jgi:23S rRNA pseudouridine955/2504/2580 synthase
LALAKQNECSKTVFCLRATTYTASGYRQQGASGRAFLVINGSIELKYSKQNAAPCLTLDVVKYSRMNNLRAKPQATSKDSVPKARPMMGQSVSNRASAVRLGQLSTDNVPPPQVRWLTVDEANEGQRLDNFLLTLLKGVPKSRIYRMVREGEVRVDKGRVSVEHRLVIGQIVRVPPVRVAQTELSHAPPLVTGQLPIVFEDDDIVVVDKPVGMAVHGGSGVSHGVIERMRATRPQAKFLELVHRIDRETSGLLLIAKRRAALVHLHDQLREHSTIKKYYAIVVGSYPLRSKRIDFPLLKTTDARGERHVIVDKTGIEAATVVRGLKRWQHALGPFTLIEATLETGRTHQIRVHMASSGFPIAGDPKYGDFTLNKALEKYNHKRMFLHAFMFGFKSRENLDTLLESPFPKSFEAFAGKWLETVKNDSVTSELTQNATRVEPTNYTSTNNSPST